MVERNVGGAPRERRQDSAVAEDDPLDGVVVREHR